MILKNIQKKHHDELNKIKNQSLLMNRNKEYEINQLKAKLKIVSQHNSRQKNNQIQLERNIEALKNKLQTSNKYYNNYNMNLFGFSDYFK